MGQIIQDMALHLGSMSLRIDIGQWIFEKQFRTKNYGKLNRLAATSYKHIFAARWVSSTYF